MAKGDKGKKDSKADKAQKKTKKTKKAASPAKRVMKGLRKLPSNIVVQEVVAAALVAAAAALADPKKARAIAGATGDELKKLGKNAKREGSALWALALDVAKRSIDTLGSEQPVAPEPEPKPPAAKPRRSTSRAARRAAD